MFNSNSFRLSSILVFVLLAVGCSTLKPVEKIDSEQPTESQAKELTTDKAGKAVDGQTSLVTPRPKAADPMKGVDAPLSLVKVYDQAKGHVKAKQIDQAIQVLKTAQPQHPKNSGPSYRLARLQVEQKDFESALESVQTAISINKDNYYAHNLKGVILREMGDFDKSKQAYEMALKVYPDYPNSHLNLAILADIFLYDLALALKHYETYMLLTGDKDKKVSGWLIDLKRRIPEVTQ